MAIIKDKKSQKAFEFTSHAAISASAAAGGTINGQIARFVGVDKIPFRLKQGDQSFYFDITKVETSSIVRTDGGIVYIPYKKSNWQDMLIGNNSDAKLKFSDTAYQQISSAFAAKISNINDDLLITQIVEEFYTASDAAFVGSATSSYDLKIPSTTRLSYSGIDAGAGVDFNIDNNSSFVTHGEFNIGLANAQLSQSIFFTSSLINFKNTAANSSSFSSHNFTFSTPTSGSVIGIGSDVININSSSATSGTYRRFLIKGRFAGDGDSGSLYDFQTAREIVIYSSSAVVASGSFLYHPFRDDYAKSQGVATEIFYLSSSDNAGPSGSYTGSCVIDTSPLGSTIHSTATLRETASYGFYYNPETDTSYLVSSSAVGNDGGAIEFGGMRVPRIVSKSVNP